MHIEKIAIKDYLHYLPVFIYIVFTLLLYFYAGSMDELPRLDVYRYRNRVLLYTATIQGFVYFFLSYKLIKKQEIKLKQEFSNAEKIRLYWLKHLNYLVLSVMFFGTMSTLFQSFSINPYPFYILYHLFIGISLYYISFQIILKPVLFSGEIPNPCLTKIPENKAQVDRSIVYKLEEVMDTLKLYINQDLSLQELSDVLNISRNQLSYVLNNYIQQNFYDYIQLLRLNECKKRLLDPKYAHLSIISIAYDSGFNSKTVFYRTFKKYEKMTPTEFQSKFLKVNN
ncbi:MAG: helix-turn-helix domain-containing protein [Dysgonamonadaceae bacterium]|nr:helix-turn-helix domain-containing protein [Dysgonamonadaceae bacterium]